MVPTTLFLLVAVAVKLVTVNFNHHKKSFYQNYDPEKIALFASLEDSQDIETPPSKALDNGHASNNNEFKLKSVSLEQASINVFGKKAKTLKNSFNNYSSYFISIPIFLLNRTIRI